MNILIHSLVNLGDVVLSTGAAALIKKNMPNAKITMMVRPIAREIVENNPVIDNVIIFDYKVKGKSFKNMISMIKEVRSRKFDVCFSFDRKLMLGIFALLLILWADVPAMLFGDMFIVNPTTTAIIGLLVPLIGGIIYIIFDRKLKK